MSTNINSWLREATHKLDQAGIKSSKLDAEIILAHTLRKPRTYLHAHGNDEVSERDEDIAIARLSLRLDRTPLAYIIGHKEFYGHNFKVTTATLIPRPESEEIIETIKKIVTDDKSLPTKLNLVDVGTGSGCLGITIKLELNKLNVTLIDISRQALSVADENANLLGAHVHLLKSDLLKNYPLTPNIIVANLPYVDPTWETSPEIQYEPSLALFADDDGLSVIYRLIKQASKLLPTGGYLVLEADPRQHKAIINACQDEFVLDSQSSYCLSFKKS